MIAFLTLCYVAVLSLLVYLKVISLNLWWKLSPLPFSFSADGGADIPDAMGCTFWNG